MQVVGKHIDPFVYVHESAFPSMPYEWQAKVAAARNVAVEAGWQGVYNVLKLNKTSSEVSLLHYPEFFESPFPELAASVHVDLQAGVVSTRNYSGQDNPPLLHRKELLLLPTDPRRYVCSVLTEQAEAAGLFDSPRTIGTRQQWLATIAAKGYGFTDGMLAPLGNELNDSSDVDDQNEAGMGAIARHRTALKRTTLSAPAHALLRRGLLRPGTTYLDYGCGYGDDVAALREIGIAARGWDPYFARTEEKIRAAVVNLGFVINVIEDRDERDNALRAAYSLADDVLSVAAMLTNRAPLGARPFADGFLTTRRTFQKYFSQVQLREYIAEVLGEEPVAVSQGVFFVFRNKELEQKLLRARYSAPLATYVRPEPLVSGERRRPKEPRHRSARDKLAGEPTLEPQRIPPENDLQEELADVWALALNLGRFPEEDELGEELAARLVSKSLTLSRGERLASRLFPDTELKAARQHRSDDLLVLLGIQRLSRRGRSRGLEPRLQRDARIFFGSVQNSHAAVEMLIQDLKNAQLIEQQCLGASEIGLGWMEEKGQLQFARTLLPRMPVLLRLYVAASTLLLGPLDQFDLVKIHSRTGKVSLLRFDNFEEFPIPALHLRVKVNFKTQEADEFVYGEQYAPPLLHHKSRYMDKDAPGYGQQLQFEARLAALGLFNHTGFGPSSEEFFKLLRDHRWEILEGDLVRSRQVPSLADPCGRYLTFKDLIECGETFATASVPNLPGNIDTYNALFELATLVLDPVIEYFGAIRLTYGFSSPQLARRIPGRIAPRLDQHCAHELSQKGIRICERGGAACDFLVVDEDMFEVAQWVYENTPADRLYVYGRDRPIHVSYASEPARLVFQMHATASGRRIPKQISKSPTTPLAFERDLG